MTKSDIIQNIRNGTDFQIASIADNIKLLPLVNELLVEGAITHNLYNETSLFPTGKAHLNLNSADFSIVQLADYKEQEF